MRTIATWVPGRGPAGFDRDLDEVFARFFGTKQATPPGRADATSASCASSTSWAPPVETLMRDGEFVVKADLPGIDPAAVELSVEENILTIKGERTAKHEEKSGDRFYREVTYGSFARGVRLPPKIDPESIHATYKDGVLEIAVKVVEKAGARKIPITTH